MTTQFASFFSWLPIQVVLGVVVGFGVAVVSYFCCFVFCCLFGGLFLVFCFLGFLNFF